MIPSINAQELIGERVRELQEYAPEPLDALASRLGVPAGQIIKLDANENPYGPTKRTLATLASYVHYHRYPDPTSKGLAHAIAEYVGIDPSTVVVGNGSDELIDLILKLFRPGPGGGGIAQVVDCPPTFGMYSFYAATNDLQVIAIPREGRFSANLPAIEALCQSDPQPRLLFLASPNNPDGQLLSDADLQRLLCLPIMVVLDEAYVDFSQHPSRARLVVEHDNLIVLRTFSKWAGLAGLRVGYGVFPNALVAGVMRLKSPYNVNCAAQVAALATLEDIAEARVVVAKIVSERQRFIEKLREISFLEVYDSQANFVLCRVHGIAVAAIREAMERRAVILRYYGSESLRDYVRISVGTPMQDESVLVTLRALERQGGNHVR